MSSALPLPMVGLTPPTREGNRRQESHTTVHKSQGERLCVADLETAYRKAIEAGGYTDKTAADVLQVSAGNLSRQLRSEPNYHLSVQRLALLPVESQDAFIIHLARRRGLDIVAADTEALALAELMTAMGRAMTAFRRTK